MNADNKTAGMRRHYSLGAIRREDLPPASTSDKLDCIALVLEPDGTWTDVKSDGNEWVPVGKAFASQALTGK